MSLKGTLRRNLDDTYTAPEVVNVTLFTDVIVDEAAGIGNGKCCYLTGEDSGVSTTALASITNPNHVPALGVSTEAKNDGETIRLCNRGTMPFDTTTLTGIPAVGDVLYLNNDGDLELDPTSSVTGNLQIARIEKLGVSGTIFIDLNSFALNNDFDGILRSSIQNQNTGQGANTAFTAINDTGDSMNLGITGSGNTEFVEPKSAIILNSGAGPTFNAIIGVFSWFWFNLSGNVMELTPDGDLTWLKKDISAKVTKTSDQSIPQNTLTMVTWDSEEYDTDDMHDNVTNNSRITFKTAGKYSILVQSEWGINSTGFRFMDIMKNGVDSIARVRDQADNASEHNIAFVGEFAVNDYIELQVFQDTGGNLDFESGAMLENTYLEAHKIN